MGENYTIKNTDAILREGELVFATFLCAAKKKMNNIAMIKQVKRRKSHSKQQNSNMHKVYKVSVNK